VLFGLWEVKFSNFELLFVAVKKCKGGKELSQYIEIKIPLWEGCSNFSPSVTKVSKAPESGHATQPTVSW